MTEAPAITAVLTVHAEGVLAGPSLASFEAAIGVARQAGLAVEGLIVLDRADRGTHRLIADAAGDHRMLETDLGDPGLARNAAVRAARGVHVGFLDGDDLWSEGWLVAAHTLCTAEERLVVAHSEVNVIFGEQRQLWWHADSRASGFDAGYLRCGNYWDAMSFSRRMTYLRFPFAANDLANGFGHEDWHWNCVTLAAGIHHRPVPGTVHFKRRRRGSQMAMCDTVQAIPFVNSISSYAWVAPQGG